MNKEPEEDFVPCYRDGVLYVLQESIKTYEAMLLALVSERDSYVCGVCGKVTPVKNCTYANVNGKFPDLENTVLVCKSCKSKVLKKTQVDGKFKIMLRYPLNNKEAIEFNLFNKDALAAKKPVIT